jgi:N-acetylmuramoyl-L-alanine amidase
VATPLERMTQASDLMVKRGLTVKESSGWENRGRPYSFNPTAGVICHHTAAAEDIDSVLINGRSDLPGPLCHWALHKNGDVVLIAAGYANHAGASKSGYPSNSNGWGIEATGPVPNNSAYGESAFPNYDQYVVMVQCIVETAGFSTSIYDIPGHKDSCDPPGRKPDPHFDMNTFRSRVAAGGEYEEADLTGDEHKWLEAIYQGMVVPGTTSVSESFEKLFNRVKAIEDAVGVPGTTTPQQSFEILYRRIQRLEDGMDALCENAGIPFDQVDTSTITG